VNHYFFNVTNSSGGATFALTATLAWNRQQNQTGINNLDLFLYNAANSNLVMCSTSLVDNVEHIFFAEASRKAVTTCRFGRPPRQIRYSPPNPTRSRFDFLPPFCGKDGMNVVLTWPAVFGIEGDDESCAGKLDSLTNPPPTVIFGRTS